jgi:putative peptidoglycan lipid II flippase
MSSLQSSNLNDTHERRSVVLMAGISAFGTLLSRILGLMRDMLIARYFSNDIRDAFINAFRLPNVFRRVFGEGSLSISFIPVFLEILSGSKDGDHSSLDDSTTPVARRRRARALVSSVFAIVCSVSITVSILSIIYMNEILHLLLSGAAYMAVPGKFELTVHLARIMFSFLVLISLYGFLTAVLNSLRKFLVTALAPCFFNIAMISAVMISGRFAVPENVLAVGVLLGGFLQLVFLFPAVIKAGFWPDFHFFRDSGTSGAREVEHRDVARVLQTILPGLLGAGISQLSIVVNMHFASLLPSGSQSYLYLGDRILELPISLFVVSVGSALLPALSRFWAVQNRQGMSETINHYIRLILFISLPAAIGMFALAQPITETLFLGREFKYSDALATTHIIQIYSLVVIFSAGVRILSQGFYAIQNTWFPAVAGAVALVCHIVFAFVLTNKFGLNGLAASLVCSSLINLLLLTAAYNSWVGKLELKRLFVSFLKFLVCAAVMVFVLQFYPWLSRYLIDHLGGRFLMRSFGLGLIIFAGASSYMLTAHILRIPEYHETLNTFLDRFKKP